MCTKWKRQRTDKRRVKWPCGGTLGSSRTQSRPVRGSCRWLNLALLDIGLVYIQYSISEPDSRTRNNTAHNIWFLVRGVFQEDQEPPPRQSGLDVGVRPKLRQSFIHLQYIIPPEVCADTELKCSSSCSKPLRQTRCRSRVTRYVNEGKDLHKSTIRAGALACELHVRGGYSEA